MIAQVPTDGAVVDQGSTVRLNVSNGPKPVAVPNVVGQQLRDRELRAAAAGFAVARSDVDSDQPADTVVATSPAVGTYQPRRHDDHAQRLEGPEDARRCRTSTGQEQSDAVQQLRASGFRVTVVPRTTTDPTQDGIVLSQDPQGRRRRRRGRP